MAERDPLQLWRAQLETENAHNPEAPICVYRSDAGFCSGENLTWQIEMGYQVETKSSSGKMTQALKARCTEQTPWTQVGKNAPMTDWTDDQMKACAHPLQADLERITLGPQQSKCSVLVRYRDPATRSTLPEWFSHYNGRQSIEAGNKRMKTVHHVQHLMSRSKSGIQIQVMLTGVACNLTQFAQPWLQAAAQKFTSTAKADLQSPKTMVRILANSTASV